MNTKYCNLLFLDKKGGNMKKKIFIICGMCLLFFATGALLRTPIREKTYYVEKNVECSATIYKTKKISRQNYEKFLSDLESAPTFFLEYCKNIYFTHENLTSKFQMPLKNKIMAISVGNDIYISTNWYSEETLMHELCHVYDYSNGWISEGELFAPLYEKYKDIIPVSPGNEQNEKEFFATCGGMFFTGKELPEEIAVFFENIE